MPAVVDARVFDRFALERGGKGIAAMAVCFSVFRVAVSVVVALTSRRLGDDRLGERGALLGFGLDGAVGLATRAARWGFDVARPGYLSVLWLLRLWKEKSRDIWALPRCHAGLASG